MALIIKRESGCIKGQNRIIPNDNLLMNIGETYVDNIIVVKPRKKTLVRMEGRESEV